MAPFKHPTPAGAAEPVVIFVGASLTFFSPRLECQEVDHCHPLKDVELAKELQRLSGDLIVRPMPVYQCLEVRFYPLVDGVHGTAVDRIYEIGQSAKLHRSHRVQIFGSRLRRQVEAIGQQRSFPSLFSSLLVRPGKLSAILIAPTASSVWSITRRRFVSILSSGCSRVTILGFQSTFMSVFWPLF
ncbi:hypothetical protein [Mycobacterium sp.]|uniref:hypothetical protein n=1 Tax=Mycobacterium sp. TaxID=1785 RepID=UPI003F9BA10F